MFGINFNRLVAAAAVMALCCGTSFAAGPKMGQHKVAKISAKKSHMTHSSKKAKILEILKLMMLMIMIL